ncbi:hypothetical protein DH86_00003574 [Scytalidium sp. 3C]|nr:hypothetical protein DH86_00003574 [Scytalidium sp. 3C]
MPSLTMAEMIVKEATDTSVNPTISYASNAPQILGVDGFFMALALVTVVARIYVRTVMLKTFGADDYIICISMICAILTFVCFIGETHHGLGWHTADITETMMIKLEHWSFYLSLAVTIGISLVKISIGFFLLRLVPGKKLKWFLYTMIAVLQSRFLQTPDWTYSDSYFVWNAIELNIGIIAACLPALRPLFAFILETTKAFTTRHGGSSSNNTKGHKYYMHEDGIGLGSMGNSAVQSRVRTQTDKDKYDVRVTTLTSKHDRGVKFGDEDYSMDSRSDDNILPPTNGGITKTVNVIVS